MKGPFHIHSPAPLPLSIASKRVFSLIFKINFNWRLINFTILWWLLPYIDKNQPWMYMCPPRHHPEPTPTSLLNPSLWVFTPLHPYHSQCKQTDIFCCLPFRPSYNEHCPISWRSSHSYSPVAWCLSGTAVHRSLQGQNKQTLLHCQVQVLRDLCIW